MLYSIKSHNAFKYSFYYLYNIFSNLNLKNVIFSRIFKKWTTFISGFIHKWLDYATWHRTATNRRRMHYLIGGTGVSQFLILSLGYAADKSVPRYDTTPAWHEYTRETVVASRKEANDRPADQPQIRLQRWLLAISRAGHARRVRREKSVIPTPCYHSRQWLVESENSFSRILNPIARYVNIYI